jgi:hypothetical protein
LMHYLFLTGLPHGKLVNLRPEQVEHAFVNESLRRLLDHTGLHAVQWINIAQLLVQFRTIRKGT